MTREELANILGISRPTLNRWEKEKPELVKLINKGLMFDELIKATKENLQKFEEIENKANNGKFRLK